MRYTPTRASTSSCRMFEIVSIRANDSDSEQKRFGTSKASSAPLGISHVRASRSPALFFRMPVVPLYGFEAREPLFLPSNHVVQVDRSM